MSKPDKDAAKAQRKAEEKQQRDERAADRQRWQEAEAQRKRDAQRERIEGHQLLQGNEAQRRRQLDLNAQLRLEGNMDPRPNNVVIPEEIHPAVEEYEEGRGEYGQGEARQRMDQPRGPAPPPYEQLREELQWDNNDLRDFPPAEDPPENNQGDQREAEREGNIQDVHIDLNPGGEDDDIVNRNLDPRNLIMGLVGYPDVEELAGQVVALERGEGDEEDLPGDRQNQQDGNQNQDGGPPIPPPRQPDQRRDQDQAQPNDLGPHMGPEARPEGW